jgi:hypothetical protein
VWVGVTEFETAAFKGFEKEWFGFVVITLLFVEYGEFFSGFQGVMKIRVNLVLGIPSDFGLRS